LTFILSLIYLFIYHIFYLFSFLISYLTSLISLPITDDWVTLIGNFPKLGLAIASMFYDVLFLLQEFVFFPGSNTPEKREAGAAKCSIASIEKGQYTNGATVLHRGSKVSLGAYPSYGTGQANGQLNNNNDSSDKNNNSPSKTQI